MSTKKSTYLWYDDKIQEHTMKSGLTVGQVLFPSAPALKKYPAADVSSGTCGDNTYIEFHTPNSSSKSLSYWEKVGDVVYSISWYRKKKGESIII